MPRTWVTLIALLAASGCQTANLHPGCQPCQTDQDCGAIYACNSESVCADTNNVCQPLDGGTQPGDSGLPDGGAPDAGLDGGAGNFSHVGLIEVQSFIDVLPGGTVQGGLAQVEVRDVDLGTLSCQTDASTPCVWSVCTGLPGSHSRNINIGVVNLSGVTGGPLMLSPEDSGYSEITQSSGPFASEGDLVSFSAAGGSIASSPFGASLSAPGLVQILSPDTLSNGFDRALPLQFTWTGGTVGALVLRFVSLSSPAVDMTCSVPVDAGGMTIPSAVLENLSSGWTQFDSYVSSSTTLDAGGYPINFSVQFNTTDINDAGYFAGTMLLQ